MRRLLGVLLALLLVLGVVGAGVDEFSRRRAEQRVAGQLAQELGGSPTVSVHGWPFLAQVVRDEVGRVELTQQHGTLDVDGHRVAFTDLAAELQGVSPLADVETAHARHLSGHAQVGWQELSDLLGAQVASGGEDRLRVSRTVSYLGASTTVVLTGVPSVEGGKLLLLDPTASADGMTLGPIAARTVADLAAQQAVLPTRAGVSVTGVHASSTGVRLDVAGDQVDLAKLK